MRPLRQINSLAMQKTLQRMFVPRSLRDRLVVTAKRLLSPGEIKSRRVALNDLPHPLPHLAAQFQQKGALVFKPSELTGAQAATEALRAYCKVLKDQGRFVKPANQRKGAFLVTVARDSELFALPEVRNFVLGPEMVNLAANYFGEVPILSGAFLWWSPPNDTLTESQIYHYDGEDRRQLKIFLNVEDVATECGPFTYLDAETSSEIPATSRHSARIDDDVAKAHGKKSAVQVTGQAGTVALVDTSRCLHYGSRGNSRERLVLMVQFTRFLAPKVRLFDWQQSLLNSPNIQGLTPVQRSMIGLTA